ncbi:MAG: hypothetical protein ACJ8AP_02685 [Gemmatimonadales bacterium]
MHHRVWFAGTLLLTACAQRFAAETKIRTSATPDQTFDCVRKQLETLGYKRSSYDTDARRISASKIDMKTQRPDTQFQRMLDKLEVEVSPQADGQTGMQVTGRTFGEYTTQRGPTQIEEKASPEVRSASQQLVQRCQS